MSDPALDLWRPLTYPATGLTIQGRVENLKMSNNRFTTWPAAESGQPQVGPDLFLSVLSPLAAANGQNDGWWNPPPAWEPTGCNWWSFVVPYVNLVDHSEIAFARYRNNATAVTLANNVASSVPFYFTAPPVGTAYSDNGGTPIASLAQGVSASSSLEHTKMRPPLAPSATQFKPIGFIGRVAPVFEPDSNHADDDQYKRLAGVAEIAIDKLVYQDAGANSAGLVRVRVAEHRGVGPGQPTYVWKTGNVYLQLLGQNTIPEAWPYGVAASTPVTLPLDATGCATFKFAMPANWHGVLAPRVWIEGDPATGGALLTEGRYQQGDAIPDMPALGAGGEGEISGAKLDEERDGWAEARLTVTASGFNAVQVFTQPDVANEKSGKRAKLIFVRTGSIANTLAVGFSLPSYGKDEVTPLPRRGTYGTTGNADYYFDWSSATYQAAVPVSQRPVTSGPGPVSLLPTDTAWGKIVFPAGSDRVIVDVVAQADDVFERETAYVRLQWNYPEPYFMVDPMEAAVLLYDGPTWTLIELTSMVYDSYQQTYLQATKALAWAINHETTAKVAGWASLPATYSQPAYQRLGWWPWNVPNYLTEVYQSPTLDANGLPLDRWHGLSTTTPTLVGQFYQRAAKWQIGGSLSYPSLPSGFNTTSGSAVYGVSPNNTYMAGMATHTSSGKLRPILWNGTTPSDLVASSPDFTSGEARGVDSSGLTVGWVDSGFQKRGFRVSDFTVNSAETFKPYVECGSCSYSGLPWDSQVFGIAPKVSGSSPFAGFVVGTAGWIKSENGTTFVKRSKMAVFWVPGGDQALKIGLLNNDGDAAAQALAINDSGEVVGWSGTSEWTGSGTVTSSAFVSRGVNSYGASPPVSLNDKHFVHALTGWKLAAAYGINNQGWIVGIGEKNGQARGFLLRKLQP